MFNFGTESIIFLSEIQAEMGSTKVDFASKEIFDTETTYLKNLNTITISLERNLRNENTEDMLIGRLRLLVTPLGQLMEYHTEKGEFPINFRSTFGQLPVDFRSNFARI